MIEVLNNLNITLCIISTTKITFLQDFLAILKQMLQNKINSELNNNNKLTMNKNDFRISIANTHLENVIVKLQTGLLNPLHRSLGSIRVVCSN